MLKAGCHICLEQLSTLQTDIQRTSKTLRRIQKQANGRVRANPELEHTVERPFHSSRSSILVEPPPGLPSSIRMMRRRGPDPFAVEVPDGRRLYAPMERPRRTDRDVVDRSRPTSPVLEDLPSVDDLVRRWTKVPSDDVNKEPVADASSDV
jgi:hypothetical protein